MQEQMLSIKPIRSNVLIKPCESDSISEGGILLPDSFKPISNKGIIVAVGNGTKIKPMKLREGMTVFRVKEWGDPIQQDGETYFLMDQEAVLATL